MGAKTKQLCAFSPRRSPSLVASNHNFIKGIHSFVIFCNDAALGPFIDGFWVLQELGNALSNLEVCWLMGGALFGFSRQYLNMSHGSPKKFQSSKVAIFVG